MLKTSFFQVGAISSHLGRKLGEQFHGPQRTFHAGNLAQPGVRKGNLQIHLEYRKLFSTIKELQGESQSLTSTCTTEQL
jgi:hypothetical protein